MNRLPHFMFAILLCAFSQNNLCAQDKLPIKFGKVSARDFDVQSPLIDSNTDAVVVADVGKSEFVANTSDLTFSLLFKRQKRVKILSKNGFGAATIEIPLYVGSNGAERVEDLDAYTYNMENGKVEDVKLERSAVYTEKYNEHWIVKKFTFPALKVGSIIEYSYEIKSNYFFNLQSWTFQGQYPVLWSQYDTGIPEFYAYVVLSQGYQPFAVNKVDNGLVNYYFTEHSTASGNAFTGSNPSNNSFKIDAKIDYHTWIMKNVPALKEEPYTTTVNNAIAKIEFQLKQIKFPNSPIREVMNSWTKVTEELMKDEDFGLPIKRANNWLDEEVAAVVKGASGPAQQTRKIYEHLRDHYTCSNYNRYRITSSLKDVQKNKSGSVADINMLMIAMLRSINIEADPVLLSTRSHGYTSEYYPLMDRYNYLIARVNTGSELYYLDASVPHLAFNRLPLQVYNGQARIINAEASPVYFEADSVSENNSTMVYIENTEKGGITGYVARNLGYYSSLEVRDATEGSGMETFMKNIKSAYSEDVEVSGITIDSLNQPEEPVVLKYDIKLPSFGEQDIVYFNPMLAMAIRKNPFNAAQRFYPVEMPYLKDDIYTLNMEIPKGYKVDELPQSARIMFNENEGMFEYLVSTDAEHIQMRCRLLLKKATFTNEDYESLRDFYAFVVKKEAEQIVFKKIK